MSSARRQDNMDFMGHNRLDGIEGGGEAAQVRSPHPTARATYRFGPLGARRHDRRGPGDASPGHR